LVAVLDPPGPERSSRDASEDRVRALEVVRRAVALGAQPAPLLLVVDDVQWADEMSRGFIRRLGRYPVPHPLLVIVTERSDRESTVAGRGIVDLAVEPLLEDDVAAWVGGAAEELHRMTGGLPLLVEEVVRRAAAGASVEEMRGSVGRALLHDRAAGLARRSLDVLVKAAVMGRTFAFDQLARVHDADELELLEDLDASVDAGMLTYDRSDPGVFVFPHDLLREAVLDRVAPLHRQALHGRVLEALGDAMEPVAAAHHAAAAGRFVEPERYAVWAERAVGALNQGFAFAQARDMAGEALARGAELGAALQAALLVGLARAEVAVGEPEAAHRHLAEAHALATVADDPVLHAEIVAVESLFGHRFPSDHQRSARLADLLGRVGPSTPWTRFELLRQLTFDHLNAGQLQAADEALAEAETVAAELGDPLAHVALVLLQHWRWESEGERRRRKDAVARASATVVDDRLSEGRIVAMQLVEALHDGDGDGADRLAGTLTEIGATAGEPQLEWLGLTARFNLPFLAGDLEEARAASVRAFERGTEAGVVGAKGAFATQTYATGWIEGDLAGFIEPLEAVVVEGPDLAWQAALALAYAVAGRTAEASSTLSATRGMISEAGGHWLNFVGVAIGVEAAVQVGDTEVLRLARPVLERRSGDHVVLGHGALDYGPVDRYLGLALVGLGDVDEGMALLSTVCHSHGAGNTWRERARTDLDRLVII
ncbi:MAG: hypothetical protein QOJ09_428, partial [Actinomycetota bacterium]|nr:hypothetical protein [Actinomycetota bacterium]